jgi:hypothetical protein
VRIQTSRTASATTDRFPFAEEPAGTVNGASSEVGSGWPADGAEPSLVAGTAATGDSARAFPRESHQIVTPAATTPTPTNKDTNVRNLLSLGTGTASLGNGDDRSTCDVSSLSRGISTGSG